MPSQRQRFKSQFTQVHTQQGEAVEGKVLIFRCRKPGKTRVVTDSGRHKALEGKLEGTAICGIVQAWRPAPTVGPGPAAYTAGA